MDQWGDHVVHCFSEVDVKFRHDLVCDILVDICSKVWIMVRKEAPMCFLSEDMMDLRPADLLLFYWLQVFVCSLGILMMVLLLEILWLWGEVLELITDDGPRCGLHLNVTKTEIFWPKEDPRSRVEGVFPPDISRPLHGRVTKTIALMDSVAKINDPQCELLLLWACTGISKLYFAMRTCPPCVFESAQRSFDVALHSALERIVTASGPGFGD
ncbi:hypothetical protein Tco_0845472 [Tanacetum coccineum]